MSIIRVKDKSFILSITEQQIQNAIQLMAEKMSNDLKDKNPVFVCVLNGAFMFASDLIKLLQFPSEVTFIRLKSYAGTSNNGSVKEIHGLIENIENRHVIVIEDIVDTGHTVEYLRDYLKAKNPQSIRIATLLFKPAALVRNVKPDYVALEISNDFIVGYGLDYDGYGRNFRDIYKIAETSK